MQNIPQQAIPHKQKDDTWRKNTVEAYIQKANLKVGANSYKHWLLRLYDYYQGKVHKEDYSYILAPYGKSRENFPVEIRNYNIIKPSIDLLLGEKAKRPFNWNVIISSDDILSVRQHAKNEKIKENLYQWFINKLNQAGFQTQMESREVQLPEQIEDIFNKSWKDNRVKMAQDALNYLIPYLKWYSKAQKGWKDFLISGYAFSKRDIRNNEPEYKILNPLNVDFDKNPDLDFVEDGNWAVIQQMATRSSVIDVFRSQLTDGQVERLQHPKNSEKDTFFWYDRDENVFHDEWDMYTEVLHVYWKSLRKVGFVTYIDEFEEEFVEQVDEDYKFNPQRDISIEWEWINEVWEGYRIDGDIYVDIQPYPHQRSSIDNPSKCKLPVNGRAYSDRNSRNISLVELGIPYQLSYNVFKYRLENAIAKSKDILAVLDINLIPENWDMDKFMHMVEATGIAWVNYAQEGIAFNPQHQSVLDMSIKTIAQYVELLRFIKEEWEYLSGITRQRMGEMSPYEGKATSQQAIIQSSHITEDYYRKYSEFEERDLQCIIDYSQLAWLNGKKGMYVLQDDLQQYLDIDPDTYTHAEFGVFVKDASVEMEKLEQFKALGMTLSQNGAPISIIAEIMDSDNFTEIKHKVKMAEQAMQQLTEQEREFQKEIEQAKQQFEQTKMQNENMNKQLDREKDITIAQMKQQEGDDSLEQAKQDLERWRAHMDAQLEQRKLSEEERSNKAQERLKSKEISVKRSSTSK